MFNLEISWIAVIVATVLAQAVGFLWYSPLLFQKRWMVLIGFNESDLSESKGKGMGKILTISVISSLVMTYVMAHLVIIFVVASAFAAVKLAFWMWLGFVATTTVHDFLWTPKPKPWALYFLNNGQMLVALIVMTLTLHYLMP